MGCLSSAINCNCYGKNIQPWYTDRDGISKQDSFKKLEKRLFSEYFSSSIMKDLGADPVTTTNEEKNTNEEKII